MAFIPFQEYYVKSERVSLNTLTRMPETSTLTTTPRGRSANGLTVRVFAKSPGDWGTIPGLVIPKLRIWYLLPHCLTLSIIRYGSRVKWSNPGKGVVPSRTPRCSSYWVEPSGHPRLRSQTLHLLIKFSYSKNIWSVYLFRIIVKIYLSFV